VSDVAAAFDAVLHRGATGETYNIGTDRERTVLDVAKDIIKAVVVPGASGASGAKNPSVKVQHVRDRAFNDRRYYIGSDKLAGLGWTEEVGWEEGLKKTIEWYLSTEGIEDYWQGDLESALRPHPVLGAAGALAAGEEGAGAAPLE
jgi:UDP-glucose 4,6-dehydratase